MIGPLAVVFIIFFILPLVLAAMTSLQRRTSQGGLGLGTETTEFAGLANYVTVMTDPNILAGFGRVFLIGIIQVPVMLGLALFMALLFDSGVVRMRQFFQTSAFLPHAIPGIVAAIVWTFLYLPGTSPIIKGLHSIGLNVDMLSEYSVLVAIMNMTTWSWTGYNMIIVYAALQSIPREILESARIDGATGLGIALRIKTPLVIPALVVTLVFSVIGSIQQFGDPAVLQSVTTNIDSRFTPNLAVFNLAMSEGHPELAAALSLVIAALAFLLSSAVLQIRDRESGRKL